MSMQLQPLVGNEAPDFVAEAVYDQEFQTISLSQYRVSADELLSACNATIWDLTSRTKP